MAKTIRKMFPEGLHQRVEQRAHNMRMDEIRRSAPEFLYQLLGRLQSDCLHYLGCGGRYAGHLWALDEREHIETMRNIFRHLREIGGTPEWITMEEIDAYAEQMLV